MRSMRYLISTALVAFFVFFGNGSAQEQRSEQDMLVSEFMRVDVLFKDSIDPDIQAARRVMLTLIMAIQIGDSGRLLRTVTPLAQELRERLDTIKGHTI